MKKIGIKIRAGQYPLIAETLEEMGYHWYESDKAVAPTKFDVLNDTRVVNEDTKVLVALGYFSEENRLAWGEGHTFSFMGGYTMMTLEEFLDRYGKVPDVEDEEISIYELMNN